MKVDFHRKDGKEFSMSGKNSKTKNPKPKLNFEENMKKKEAEFNRELGKIGSAICIILVAFFFKIPQNLKNLYYMIAILLVIAKPLLRIFKEAWNTHKTKKNSINWIEVLAITITAGTVLFGQYMAAAIFITIADTLEIIRTRPI